MSDLQGLIVESLRGYGFDRVSRVPLEEQAREFLSGARIREQINLVRRFVPELQGKQLLEVGSGFGMFVAICNLERVCEAFGIEPGADAYGCAYDISQEILRHHGVAESRIRKANGENIPFEENSFDVIWSTNVLEHVQDPARVLREVFRVLRPGGTAIVVVPNYGSWWEGHYGLLFPPHCPKWLFKALVSGIGRDPAFVDTLQFVTYGKLQEWLAPFRDRIEVITWGQEIWEERLRSLAFSEWAALASLKSILRAIHRLGLVEPVIWLGKRLHWETPFSLVFKKR